MLTQEMIHRQTLRIELLHWIVKDAITPRLESMLLGMEDVEIEPEEEPDKNLQAS